MNDKKILENNFARQRKNRAVYRRPLLKGAFHVADAAGQNKLAGHPCVQTGCHSSPAGNLYNLASRLYVGESRLYNLASRLYNLASRLYNLASRIYNLASRLCAGESRLYNQESRLCAGESRLYNLASRLCAGESRLYNLERS
jgi:putative membrane protein